MTGVDNFVGNWIYRSFHNDPEVDTPVDDLIFAIANLTFEAGECDDPSANRAASDPPAGLELPGSDISGRLSFPQSDLYLTVSGTAVSGTAVSGTAASWTPPTIRWRAIGVEGTLTAGWIYDYVGYLAPCWPNGDGQRPAIVGTAIRTVAHKAIGSDEIRPAGYTVSLVAVSSDRP